MFKKILFKIRWKISRNFRVEKWQELQDGYKELERMIEED